MADEHDDIEQALRTGLSQAGAMMREALVAATTPDRYEYKLVGWDEVNPLAREGWELRAADVTLRFFIMGRKLTVADQAAELLADT